MFQKPDELICEVSLLGTGGGYGESIVIHLGENNWMVVDSCINPESKRSIPLEYLEQKGVNVKKEVKLIVCTHWHDDHVRGISELLSVCETAKFCMADTTDREKFMLLLRIDFEKSKSQPRESSMREIKNCFEILMARNQPATVAFQDRLLLKLQVNALDAAIYSLSPSDLVKQEFNSELSVLINEFGPSRKIINRTPNEKCVVLYINVNGHGILLGADMEVSNDNRRGWRCILNECECLVDPCSLFKIPHHGSSNGYEERIWNELLSENVTAKLTPWNKGKGLPTKKMLNTFVSKTNKLYITSLTSYSGSQKKRSRDLSKAISRLNPTLREEKFDFGIVRCRLDYSSKLFNWDTSLFQGARQISKEML